MDPDIVQKTFFLLNGLIYPMPNLLYIKNCIILFVN